MGKRDGALLLSACMAVVVGCAPEPLTLAVDLRTDLVAGVEFVAVRTTLDGLPGRPLRHDVRPDTSYALAQRLAEVSELEPGPQSVEVTLLDRDDVPVASRTLLLTLDASAVVTVIVTRDCLGVDCGEGASCAGGRCVDPRCVEGDEPECAPECAGDGDCDAAPDCASTRCVRGLCLFEPDDTRCEGGRYCQPACGCAPRPTAAAPPPADPADACVAPLPPPPACPVDCDTLPNVAAARCEDGVCVIEACEALADCNGDPSDGCEAAPSWSATLGGDHCGEDWIAEADGEVGGAHVGVGRFEVPPDVTLAVRPRTGGEGGSLEVDAVEAHVFGVIDATGAGHVGGRGGAGRGSGSPFCGGTGENGGAGGGLAGGGAGGGGAGHGGGDSSDPGCRDARGGPGGAGGAGGYGGSGVNADASTDDTLDLGSGGGGGGGGGAGSRFGGNNNFPAGTGGGGGAGGRGGGLVRLRAASAITLEGAVRTRGTRDGGDGGDGRSFEGCERYQEPGGGAGGNPAGRGASRAGGGTCQDFRVCGGGSSNTCGGAGGRGGPGSGGGVLLRAPAVTVTGQVDARGGQSAANGGTLKVRACSHTPGEYLAGRVHEAPLPGCP